MMQAGDPEENLIQTYHNYLQAQSTIHAQSILVDLMMSDRVLHCAQCLDRNRINQGNRIKQGNRINQGLSNPHTRRKFEGPATVV